MTSHEGTRGRPPGVSELGIEQHLLQSSPLFKTCDKIVEENDGARNVFVCPDSSIFRAPVRHSSSPGLGQQLGSPEFDSLLHSLPDLCQGNPNIYEPIDLVQVLIKAFWASRSGLTAFTHACLSGKHTCNVQGKDTSSLWPVPPPRWLRWTAFAKLGPRRRRRHRFLRARHELLQLVVCAMNWETLGFPIVPPTICCVGAHISPQQHGVLEHLESLLMHFLRMEPFDGASLGRGQEKFQLIINALKELPRCHQPPRLEDLTDLCSALHASFDPYSAHFERKPKPSNHFDDVHQCSFATTNDTSGSAPDTVVGAKRVQSDRVKWENGPSFHAEFFLSDPLVKAAYLDPEVLRKPVNDWPKSYPAKIHCSRDEFLKLVHRWDQLGACHLIPAESKSFEEAVGLFCVGKDETHDRLIINPKTINSRMFSLSDSTKELAPGCLLALLHLKPHDMFRFNADDLTDYYYTFCVSEARAARNAFRMKFQDWELEGLGCFREDLRGKEILVCLRTLAMGDSLAVEVAQQAHSNVLKFLCGAMLPHEVLRYRHPVPRSSFIELLAIDDHIGIQRLPRASFREKPFLRDSQVFKSAESAYKAVGLVQHERKRKRNQTQGILLGADFDGDLGRVMAPRSRLCLLCLVSACIASIGTCTPKLLSIVNGCWIHVLMFRRVLFSIMDALFKEGTGVATNQPFCLSRKARSELQLLSILGPLAQTDLRVKFSDRLYTTDASPFGGAVCYSQISEEASAELWRHTEQKGFYTRLQSPVAEILREKGIDPLSEEMFQSDPVASASHDLFQPPEIPRHLEEGILFDCVEIFRGCGNWSSAHASHGLSVHAGFDCDGRSMRVTDLADPAIFHELVGLALRRVVRDWHAGVPCLSFGTLRRPQVRSIQQPAGFDINDPFTKYHNTLARRTAFVLTIAYLLGAFISVEQPRNSRLFLLHCFKVLIQLGCIISHFSHCQYGSGFHKPSKWLHNKPWIIPLEGKCACNFQGRHFVVRGSFTSTNISDFKNRCKPSCISVYGRDPKIGEPVSSFSAMYPFQLVNRMASGLVAAKHGSLPLIPMSKRIEALREVGLDDSAPVVAPSTEPLFAPRPWFEDPEWISEVCDSLPFKELFRFKFRVANHININEVRTYKSWIKSLAKSEPHSRCVGLVDSRVTIGATAKGRSSSPGIFRILQGCIGYIIGSNLYPGCLHCYSDRNRSDGPSRGKEIVPPSKPIPFWLSELLAGRPHQFDLVVAASKVSKNPARWLRMLLMLAGDIEPHPGPRKTSSYCPRGPMDLSVGFAEATHFRMSKCYEAFKQWVQHEAGLAWASLEDDPQAVAWALRAYGMFCFEKGVPRYMYVYAITAVQDQLPICRPYLSIAWQIDRKWQVYEPGQSRAVLPAVVVRAAVCVGCLWQWRSWTALILIGFSAMLHPAEIISLRRRDLVFPEDIGSEQQSLFIHLRDPKTARFARRQHGRIDDFQIISVCRSAFGACSLDEFLYAGSMHLFRRQWNAVMSRLGVPHKQNESGATPGVLRGSGATFLYTNTEDIQWVAWRGRWSRVRTLEYYLQEVGAQLLMHSLDWQSKATIKILSDAAWPVLCREFSLTE